MKKMVLFSLALILSSATITVRATGPDEQQILQDMNTMVAKNFLKSLEIEDSSIDLDRSGLKSYLKERIENAKVIMAGDKSELEQEFKSLNHEWCFFFVMNHMDSNPNARVVYNFPKMAGENMAHSLRTKLKCRVGELADFEKPYEQIFEKVSGNEFKRRLDSVSKDEIDILLLQSSQNLAKAILKELGE